MTGINRSEMYLDINEGRRYDFASYEVVKLEIMVQKGIVVCWIDWNVCRIK